MLSYSLRLAKGRTKKPNKFSPHSQWANIQRVCEGQSFCVAIALFVFQSLSVSYTKYAIKYTNDNGNSSFSSIYWMNIIACSAQISQRNVKLWISYTNLMNKNEKLIVSNWNDAHRLSCRNSHHTQYAIESKNEERIEKKKKRENSLSSTKIDQCVKNMSTGMKLVTSQNSHIPHKCFPSRTLDPQSKFEIRILFDSPITLKTEE